MTADFRITLAILIAASLGILTSPVSAVLIGPFIDAYGRKKGLELFYLIMGLGFGVIAFAQEVYHIFIGRIICAFASGLGVIPIVYIAEICTKEQRSALLSQLSAVFSGGTIIPFIISCYLPWNVTSAIFSLACLILFIAECFTTESPVWLYKMGQQDAATTSLQSLGRTKSQIAQELDHLRQSKETSEKAELRIFFEPTVWKPFLILCVFQFLLCATGEDVITFYTVDFVQRLGTTYNLLHASILLSSFKFLSNATLGVYFKSIFSRKFATAFSSFWMALALGAAGIYEYKYHAVSVPGRHIQWFPLACVVVYVVADSLAMNSLPHSMCGELFPLKVRGTMAGAVSLVAYTLSFVSVKIYFVCVEALRIHGLLLAFASIAAVTVFFAIFILPETHNKHLHEIEQGFRSKQQQTHEPSNIEQ